VQLERVREAASKREPAWARASSSRLRRSVERALRSGKGR